jgi:adenine-specific DNA-methyltransferase
MRSPRGGIATEEVKQLFGAKVFQHPKPLALIKTLLAQATRPHDIVLDFFAGSGTTGQAVLELNAEDAGQRRYILCSSTEATSKEPDKNLCRDVCAERLRRVSLGYADKTGYAPKQRGEFGYLQLDRISVADAPFEFDAANAFQWLSLQRFGVAQPVPSSTIRTLGEIGDCAVLICEALDKATIDTLAAWPAEHGVARLAVYCARPKTLQEQLDTRGVAANAYSLLDALLAGGGA